MKSRIYLALAEAALGWGLMFWGAAEWLIAKAYAEMDL
jgi:hypothetical protein